MRAFVKLSEDEKSSEVDKQALLQFYIFLQQRPIYVPTDGIEHHL